MSEERLTNLQASSYLRNTKSQDILAQHMPVLRCIAFRRRSFYLPDLQRRAYSLRQSKWSSLLQVHSTDSAEWTPMLPGHPFPLIPSPYLQAELQGLKQSLNGRLHLSKAKGLGGPFPVTASLTVSAPPDLHAYDLSGYEVGLKTASSCQNMHCHIR